MLLLSVPPFSSNLSLDIWRRQKELKSDLFRKEIPAHVHMNHKADSFLLQRYETKRGFLKRQDRGAGGGRKNERRVKTPGRLQRWEGSH